MNKEIKHRIEKGRWIVCEEPREFPCNASGNCPYEYGPQNPERNVEGMPLIGDDSRECPTYGHVCPVFMEDFGFTPEDLEIRAKIHCGRLVSQFKDLREKTKNADQILARYERTVGKYPMAAHLEYYV
jgi:hypothetical protein